MSPPRVWRTGEPCRVTVGDRSVDAVVELASSNGESLALIFEAFATKAGLYLNGAALTWHEASAAFFDLRTGEQFDLAARGAR